MSRSTTQRVTHAIRRFTLRGRERERAPVREPAAAEHCELCAMPLHEAHDHLLDPHARGVFCACSACAVLFPEGTATTSARYVRVRSRVSALPQAAVSEHDLLALGAPVRLAVLCPSTLHETLFVVCPSAAGPVESRASLKTWRALAAKHPGLEAVQPDRDAVIADLRAPARTALHVSLDVAYELLGRLKASAHANRFAVFELRLAALQRTGVPHG